MLSVTSLDKQIIKALKGPRHHVKRKLASARFVFEQNGESANETGDYDIPSVDLVTVVLCKTQEVPEDSDVDSKKKRRFHYVLKSLNKGLFRPRMSVTRNLLLDDLFAFE